MKKILISGGSSGIGLALVAHFKCLGNDVAIIGRTEKFVMKAEADLNVKGMVSDIQNANKIIEWANNTLGGLDIVINTAGVNSNSLEDMIQTNILSTYNIITSAASTMTSGSIVLFSGGGVGGPNPGKDVHPIYTATKAATVQLVECLANKYPHVRINAVAPGKVATQMTNWEGDNPHKATQLIDWLCSDAASHITGRLLSIRDEDYWNNKNLDPAAGRLRRIL